MSKLDINQIISDLDINDDKLVEIPSTSLSVSDKSEAEVNPNVIYSRLNKLIETGDNLLQTTQYLINTSPDAENISSAASLISSIRDVVHEFTTIHRDRLKFEQQLTLEKFKAQEKEKLLKMRLENNSSTENHSDSTEMLEYSQESIIDHIIKKELT